MKKIILSLFMLCLALSSTAQTWTASGSNIYYTGGNVGIGTSTPTLAPLHVTANNVLVQLRLERTGTSPGISTDIGGQSGNLTFYPGGYYNKNGNVSFSTTGKVGIGTESPEDILHIFSPGLNGSRVTSLLIDGYSQNTLVDGSSQVIRFKGNQERYWGAIGGYTANSKEGMGIFAGSSTSLTPTPGIYLNSDQKVGIGTTTPEDKLQVVSGEYNDIFSVARNAGGNENTFDFRITSNPNGASALNSRSLTILPTQYAADIALLTDPTLTQPQFVVKANGNVGIGTTTPSEKLSVDGTVLAKKVKVSVNGGDWPDFVFAPNFKLRTLNELEAYIKTNQHLPEVPSAKEVEENGLDLGKMDATLLQKVEELTLYLIDGNKEKDALKTEVSQLKKENQELKAMFLELKREIEALKKQ